MTKKQQNEIEKLKNLLTEAEFLKENYERLYNTNIARSQVVLNLDFIKSLDVWIKSIKAELYDLSLIFTVNEKSN